MSDPEHEAWIEQCVTIISKVLAVEKEKIFLKLRQRKPGRTGQYRKAGDSQHEFIVSENGLKFIVNLADYLDTGLFLDHRITRQMVRQACDQKLFLNLFSYTGSFSVYAAAGNAAEVVSVDLSKTYLNWSERNMKLNGYNDLTRYRFVHADVKQYLTQIPPGYFDIVVIDPPTFSNSKRMEDFLDVQRDHVSLINGCLKGLKKGGIIYFSTNFTKFQLDGASIQASSIKDITSATTPFDFKGRAPRYCFMIAL